MPGVAFQYKVYSSAKKIPDKEVYASFINYLNTFKYFQSHDLDGLHRYWNVKKIKKNEFFYKEDEVIQNCGLIIQGGIKIYRKLDSGNHVFALLTESFFCTMKKTMKNNASKFNAMCVEPTILVTITPERMEQLSIDRPAFLHFFNHQNEKSLLYLQQRLTSFQVMTARERYEDLLTNYPEILSRFSVQDVAGFLGMQAETLSRIRNTASRLVS
ncbi:MAG: cyclic nucleotide-binding protein [Bacteroidota bacterium]|nr:cyclic nucleotide-binding protein [Bacteroidota bacterium]